MQPLRYVKLTSKAAKKSTIKAVQDEQHYRPGLGRDDQAYSVSP